jgi:hypothetical protein
VGDDKVSGFLPVATVTDVKDGTMKKIMVEGHGFYLPKYRRSITARMRTVRTLAGIFLKAPLTERS